MSRRYDMDRRAYIKTIGAGGAVAAFAGCTTDDSSSSNEEIVPGTASGFPPFELTRDGELVGFDIELAEAVIDEAGYDHAEWTDIEFDSLIPSLSQSEDIDMIAAAMTITDERAEQIAFTDPYYEANQAILVRAGGSIQPEEQEDLSGVEIGVQSGTTGENLAEGLIEDGIISGNNLSVYDNYTLAVEDLTSELIGAIVIDTPVARDFESNRDVAVAFTIPTGEQYGFGMRQDDDRIEDINDALATVRENGTYEEIANEWDVL
jgi:polar amino acid transport system substrate-binding protein